MEIIMSIQGLRKEIDMIDEKLLELLNARARYAIRIGEEKNSEKLDIFDRERETYIINRMVDLNKGPLSERDVNRLFTEIVAICREIQL
jgi:chorismate mutase-like protein